VKSAAAFITGQAVLRKDKSVTGVLVKGIDVTREQAVNNVAGYTDGAWKELKGGTIILGRELMESAGISVGDEVELLVAYSAMDMEKMKLKVIGSFTSGRYDYDSNMAVVDLDTAMRIFRMKDAVSGVALRVSDEMAVNNIRDSLQAKLGYPFVVKSWMDLDKNLVAALALEKKPYTRSPSVTGVSEA